MHNYDLEIVDKKFFVKLLNIPRKYIKGFTNKFFRVFSEFVEEEHEIIFKAKNIFDLKIILIEKNKEAIPNIFKFFWNFYEKIGIGYNPRAEQGIFIELKILENYKANFMSAWIDCLFLKKTSFKFKEIDPYIISKNFCLISLCIPDEIIAKKSFVSFLERFSEEKGFELNPKCIDKILKI